MPFDPPPTSLSAPGNRSGVAHCSVPPTNQVQRQNFSLESPLLHESSIDAHPARPQPTSSPSTWESSSARGVLQGLPPPSFWLGPAPVDSTLGIRPMRKMPHLREATLGVPNVVKTLGGTFIES